jgi:hypothetical protein
LTRLCEQLLAAERGALGLLGHNPFPERPPREIRALMYQYQFTTRSERTETGAIWKRELMSELFRTSYPGVDSQHT